MSKGANNALYVAICEDKMGQDQRHTQQTTPKGINPKTGKPYEPIEIPVPTRKDVEDLLTRAAQGTNDTRDQ